MNKTLCALFFALFAVLLPHVASAQSVARIGSTEYATLAEAIAAVPTDGTATTITMLANEMVDVATSPLTIDAGKNVVLELAGHTISETLSKSGTSALITNNGTLVIQDNTDTNKDGTGTGKITYQNGNPDQASVPGYASNTIINQGNLTIESGYIENTTSGGYAAYTVDNLTNGGLYTPTFTMNGGKLYNSYTDAVRMFLNSTTNLNKVVINGGVLDSQKASGRVVVVHMPSKALGKGELDITGGTIKGTVNGWSAANDGGVEDQFSDAQYENVSINISGGCIKKIKFTEMANETLRANSLVVTGGVYEESPEVYVASGYAVLDNTDEETKLAFPYKVDRKPIAQIGSTTYPSLAEAIAAVPTDGTQTTITMIADETVAGGSTLTIAATKNIVLDLNGKTITGSSTTSSPNFYFITNNGTLEITDNSEGALGKITYGCSAATYSNEYVTICNEGGTFTLTNGKIENTSGGLSYAVNNRSVAQGEVATFNLNGGTISAPMGDAALRVYQSAGTTTTYSDIVNINGGTILDSGIFVDEYISSNLPENYDGSNVTVAININGGTVNGLIDFKMRHPFGTSLNITDGVFGNAKLWVRKYTSEYRASTEPTAPIVHISGGKFSFENNKAFGLAYDCGATSWTSYTQPYDVSDGVFNVDLNNFSGIAFPEGKTGVANTDPTTKTAYPYTVGSEFVAQIGETKYATLAEAISAASNLTTIAMIANSEENVLWDVTSPKLKNSEIAIYGEYTLTSPNGNFGFYFGDYDSGNRPETDKVTVSGITMQKSGGNYTTLFDGVTANLNDVTIIGDGNTALSYANGAVGTLTNVTVTNTGSHTQTWRNTALALQGIGSGTSEVTVKSGSYTSVNGYAVYMFSSGGTLNIEGGTFSGALMSQIDNNSYPDNQSIINISGGTFANCTLTESGGENAQIYVSGGTFSINPTAYVLPGYAAVETVIDNTTWWKVGEVVTGDMTEKEVTSDYEATYEVKTQVVDNTEGVLDDNHHTKTVTVAIANDESNIAEDAKLIDLNMNSVISKSLNEVPDSYNDINVEIAVVATAETPAVANTLVFEVHPEATVYVNSVEQGTVELANADLAQNATFTFKLTVTDTFENGTEVKVVHKSSDPATYPDETFYATVSDGKVTITVSHFSDFELSAVQQFSELDVELVDGTSYEDCVGMPVTADVTVKSASYVRTVRDNFCAWYVPFNYTLTSSDINYINFYRINLIANAVAGAEVTSTDQIWVYLTRMEAGETLTANRPYVFKAKSGSWEQTFKTSGATLCAPATDSRLENSTTANRYDFYGTYATTTTLHDDASNHYFYVDYYGEMSWPGSYNVSVGPYRWYIKATQKGGGAYYAPSFIFTDNSDVTGISNDVEFKTVECYYDLKGRKIEKPAKGAYLVKFTDGSVRKVVK